MKVNDPRINGDLVWKFIDDNISWTLDPTNYLKYHDKYWEILTSFGYENNLHGQNKEIVSDYLCRIDSGKLMKIYNDLRKLVNENK